MSKVIAIIVFVIVCNGLVMSPASAADNEPLLRIFFVPFSIETFLPIKRETLEKGDPIVFMQKHQFIEEFLNLLQAHPTNEKIATIESLRALRLKADFVEKGEVFFASQSGLVIRERDGRTFQLSNQEMGSLEERIEYFRGVVDTRAAKQYKK